MADLYLHQREVNTIFDLLGGKENDITYSVGWAFSRCEVFANQFLRHVFPATHVGEVQAVQLQSAGKKVAGSTKHGGFTDIELLTPNVHAIVEAKRGWNLPAQNQLARYVPRFKATKQKPALVVIAECSAAYAAGRVPKAVASIPVVYMSWKQIRDVARSSRPKAAIAERRMLDDICNYLEGLMTMQNVDSNLVYVVALGADQPVWCLSNWRQIVQDHDRYFCPFGVRGWPKRPPNYLGFRYKGRLQSIRHVQSYIVTKTGKEIAAEVPTIDASLWDKQNRHADLAHFVFRLGPTIVPQSTVKTGAIFRNGRVWAALDLLLTSGTISDAREKTKARRNKP